jgi:hypothetical protein
MTETSLVYLHASSGTGTIPTATIKIVIEGQEVKATSIGVSGIDATWKAIGQATGLPAVIIWQDTPTICRGQNDEWEFRFRLSCDGKTAMGYGKAADIIVAAALAYVDGLNRLAALETPSEPINAEQGEPTPVREPEELEDDDPPEDGSDNSGTTPTLSIEEQGWDDWEAQICFSEWHPRG